MRKTILLLGISALLLTGCVQRKRTAGRLLPKIGKEPPLEFTEREKDVLGAWDLMEPTLYRKLKGYSDGNAARLDAYEIERLRVNGEELKKFFPQSTIELLEPGLSK